MYKVLKRFIDRYDGKVYESDQEYIPQDKERAKQLINLGYIQEVEKPRRKKKSGPS